MLRRIAAGYARLLSWLLAFSVAVLIIPVSLQIFSRYTQLIPPYIWTEEMARFLFIWMIMIGAMVGVRESSHFEVDVWPRLGPRGEAERDERRTEAGRDVHRRRGAPVDAPRVRRTRMRKQHLPSGVRQRDLPVVHVAREDEVEPARLEHVEDAWKVTEEE